jgi:hypothetical protein
MKSWLVLRLTGIILPLLVFGSCAIVFMPYYSAGGDWPARVFFDHRYKLPSGGSLDLLIEEVEAVLEIVGQKEEEVHIVASQSLPFYRRGVMMGGLSRSSPRIEVETQESALKIRVEGRKQTLLPVNISLTVPRNVNLERINLKEGNVTIRDLFGRARIDLERGNLKVQNFSGSLEASVMKGNLEAEVLDLRENDDINLLTEEGDITLFLEPEASAQIEAQALHGRLTFEFPHEKRVENYLLTTLREGGAKIFLRSMKGDIKIKKIE